MNPDASVDVLAPRQELMAGSGVQTLQAAYLQLARRIVAETIHYGESEERGIRGQASRAETGALLEEGIAVLPLPLPEGLKGPLQ